MNIDRGRPVQSSVIIGWPGTSGRLRNIKRLADKTNRAWVRRRSKRAARAGRPVGPELIRGRGIARRRRTTSVPRVLVYLLLSAAGVVFLFKYVVVPFLTG
jgi:hypothetical protein